MYAADPQAIIMDFIGQLMHDSKGSFKQRLISTLARLNKKEWCLLAKIVNDMAKKDGDA